MSNPLDNYRKRVLMGATSRKDRLKKSMERFFQNYLDTTPTCSEVPVTKVEQFPKLDEMEKQLVSINDITNNDQTALDEKTLSVPKDMNIDVGCYLFWDNCWWLVWFKEHKSMNTYKKFTIRRCNQIIHFKYDGVVYDIPVSISNLTMYSDGLSDIAYLKYYNCKRQVSYGSNPITRKIWVGYRMILTEHVTYRITHINSFEYNGRYTGATGLVRALVLATVSLKEDDKVNDIAWNGEKINGSDKEEDLDKILGNDYIYIGAKNTYSIKTDKNVKWQLDSRYYESAYLKNDDENGFVFSKECTIEAKSNYQYVGYNVCIIAMDADTNETIDTIIVKIRGV